MDTQLNNNIRESETGFAGIIFLTSVSCLFLYWYRFGDQLISADPHLALILLSILTVVAIFSSSFFIAGLVGLGFRSDRSLRRDLKNKVADIHKFIDNSNMHLGRVRTEAGFFDIALPTQTHETIARTKGLLSQLKQRCEDVDRLMFSGDQIDLVDAGELLEAKMYSTKDRLNSLIVDPKFSDKTVSEVRENIAVLLKQINEDLAQSKEGVIANVASRA